ncbi:MAG: Ig-like domain-containing protein, partial [Clostridia bacterium]|nr:Ig-like domain-containing protein [Clostridia bacterium]
MKSKFIKKTLALIISVVIMISMIPLNVFSYAGTDNLPVMEAYNAASSGDYHKYYNKVVSVTFLDSIDFDVINSSDTIDSWDVSSSKDGSVMAWMKLNSDETSAAGADRYNVYIAGNGGIEANQDSSYVFYCFSALKNISGFENFHTDNTTTLYRFFEKCSSLETIDLSSMNTSSVKDLGYMFSDCSKLICVDFSGWNTENVTTMRYMFNNCVNIPSVDLSSFSTKNVTNMERLFYRCEKLTTVYVSDKWNTDAVTNSTAMFNCCYLIEGLIKYDAYALNDKTYADTDHYLTDESEKPQPVIKRYKVTYIFEGPVPDGIVIYPEEEFNEGTLVSVKPDFSADGYEFSGWSSDDAEFSDGEFIINNNIVIIGSWSKLYNVIYRYEGYVPEGAPIPKAYEKKAGTGVTVDPLPFVDGYVFSGWSTEDVATSDGRFTMPEKDVVLIGSFRKPVESVEINGESFTVNFGEEINLQVTVKPEDATVKDLTYTTSDEKVVTVDKYGKITTVGEGTAVITVVSNDDPTITDTVIVIVKLPVTDISINKDTFNLYTEETDKIEATVNENATNKNLTYISSDEKVVIVDENGNIKAIGEGTATITVVSDDNPDIREIITVNVKNPVTDITVADEFTLNIKEERNLEAEVNDNATNKKLIYESENPEIAKVDSDGNVIAVGEGTTTITIISEDNPNVKETVTVTVKIPVESIKIINNDILLPIDKTQKLTIEINPQNATDKELIFKSENEDVASVDTNGNITANKEGTTTITVISKDNPDATDKIQVTVKVPVSGVEIKDDDFELEIGESKDLTTVLTPGNATNKELIFESSDSDIAKVDNNGKITAENEGTVVITVYSKDDPTKTDAIVITVKAPEETTTEPE